MILINKVSELYHCKARIQQTPVFPSDEFEAVYTVADVR